MEEKQLYEIIYDSLVDMGLLEKYGRPGIYSISIGDKLVYIGKSRDMLHRVASHLANIEQDKAHKYQILRQAREEGYQISFDVVQYCQQDDQEISDAEARLIQKHMPPLNYQIPKIGQSGYFTNKEALTITLKEIMENGNCCD